jgi:hypothetical protein
MPGGGVRTLLRLPWSDRFMLAHAAFCLLAARLALRWLPFRTVSAHFGVRGCVSPLDDAPRSIDAAHRITWAIAAAARRVPWTARCLEQALAARWMLRSRNVASTFYIGVEVGTRLELGSLEAHAWLRSGSVIVSGAEVRDRFTTLVTYGDSR